MPPAVPTAPAPLATTLESLGFTFTILAEYTLGDGRVAWLDVRPTASSIAYTSRDLAVEETGTVARLRVRNGSAFPILLPSDLVFGGGKQTRTVERSVVIAAGAAMEIPVRCVERKRWDPGQGASDFRVEGTLSSVTRASFVRMKDRAFDDRGTYGLEQQQVWSEVRDELTRTGVSSTTESYADFLRATRPPPAARRAAHESPPQGANGVALLIGDRAAWFEAFASEDHLRAQAEGLQSDFRSRVDGLGAPCSSVERAIHDVARAALVPIDRVSGTLGEPFALRGAGAVGAVLLVDGALAHVAVSVGDV